MKESPLYLPDYLTKNRLRGDFGPTEGNLALSLGFPKTSELSFPEKNKSYIAGFNTRLEYLSLVRNIDRGLKEGFPKEVAVKKSIYEIVENYQSWINEYGLDNRFVPIHYSLRQINGKTRLVGKSGYPIVDSILEKERFGAAKRFAQINEQFLTEVKSGVSIGFSPLGRSNLQDESGREIIFPDSYLFVYIIENGQIKAVTIRTNLTLQQCELLSSNLSRKLDPSSPIKLPTGDIDQRAANLVKEGIFAKGQLLEFAELVLEIVKINPKAFGSKFPDQKSILNALANYEQSFKFKLDYQKYTKELEDFAIANISNLHNFDTREFIESRLQDMIFKATLAIQGIDVEGKLTLAQKMTALNAINQMHGCAGSGKGAKGSFSFIPSLDERLRIGVTEETWTNGTCDQCGSEGKVSCNLCKTCVSHAKEQEQLGLKKLT